MRHVEQFASLALSASGIVGVALQVVQVCPRLLQTFVLTILTILTVGKGFPHNQRAGGVVVVLWCESPRMLDCEGMVSLVKASNMYLEFHTESEALGRCVKKLA
jgi:hypothetical protein